MNNLDDKELSQVEIGARVKIEDCFGVFIVEATFYSTSKGNEASVKNDKGSYMFVPFSEMKLCNQGVL